MFLSFSKLVEIALQVEFSCGLVRYQSSIVAYLAVRKLGSITTTNNILFARRKMAATNMFLLLICFVVCTNIIISNREINDSKAM